MLQSFWMYEYNLSFIVVEKHMDSFVDESKTSDEGQDESEKELYMPRAP